MAGPDTGFEGLGNIFMASFATTRQLMQERADRLAWQEALPGIQAKLAELGAPLEEAQAEADATDDPQLKAKARSKQMAALRNYAAQGMDLAAKLAASGNQNALKYAEGLQATVTQVAKIGFEQAKMETDAQARAWQQDFDQRRAEAEDSRYERGQAHMLEREGIEDQRYADTQAQGQQDRALMQEDRRLDNARADRSLDLQERGIALDEEKARRGPPADPVEKYKAAIGLGSAFAEGAISKETRDAGYAELGISGAGGATEVKVEDLPKQLQQRVSELREIRDTSPDPETKKMAEGELAEAMKDLSAFQRARVESTRAQRMDPRGWFRKIIDEMQTLKTPDGGMRELGESGARGGEAMGPDALPAFGRELMRPRGDPGYGGQGTIGETITRSNRARGR